MFIVYVESVSMIMCISRVWLIVICSGVFSCISFVTGLARFRIVCSKVCSTEFEVMVCISMILILS